MWSYKKVKQYKVFGLRASLKKYQVCSKKILVAENPAD